MRSPTFRQAAADTRSTTMRAARVTAPGRVEVINAAIPEPGADEVRIRLEGCGVCASNVPPFEGRAWFSYPFAAGALGHEGWGHVDAVGADVAGVRVGDRVACLTDHAYAEYDVANARSVVALPEALDGRPVPGEPLGCSMNILRRADIGPGETVAIVGIGFLGAVLTQLATHAGARVIALSRRGHPLEAARRLGATNAERFDDPERVIEHVSRLTDGALCDAVIECTGKQEPLTLAAALTRVRGRLVIAGYHQDGPREIDMQLWNWRGLDVINAHERDPRRYTEGMQRAVVAMTAGLLTPDPLYTHTYRLDELGDALRATRERPGHFIKALIDMNRDPPAATRGGARAPAQEPTP